MTSKKKNNHVPLIVEPHPEDYDGYPFITLVQYKMEHYLTIIDNTTNKKLLAFVLDYCGPERVDEEKLISIAIEWYENNFYNYPISFEFSKRGVSEEMSRIHRAFNVEYTSRVIGPMPQFNMNETKKVRRRRRKTAPAGVQVKQQSD